VLVSAVAADRNEEHLRIGGAQALRHLEAVHPGHPEVDQRDLRLERARHLEARRSRMGHCHGVTALPQQRGERGPGVHVVVHNENTLRAIRAGRGRRSGILGGHLAHRQMDDELAARSGTLAPRFDRAPVRDQRAPAQREPETHSPGCAATAHERLEDPLGLGSRDTRSGIPHRGAHQPADIGE